MVLKQWTQTTSPCPCFFSNQPSTDPQFVSQCYIQLNAAHCLPASFGLLMSGDAVWL